MPGAGNIEAVNDDQDGWVGRALDALFDADRASQLTTVCCARWRPFDLDTAVLR